MNNVDKSQVFWNILHQEVKQMIMEETGQEVDDDADPLNGMSLPFLFGEEFEVDIASSFRISYTMKFICSTIEGTLARLTRTFRV
jgi:hypothetical protein